jgi:hypothetical protein
MSRSAKTQQSTGLPQRVIGGFGDLNCGGVMLGCVERRRCEEAQVSCPFAQASLSKIEHKIKCARDNNQKSFISNSHLGKLVCTNSSY